MDLKGLQMLSLSTKPTDGVVCSRAISDLVDAIVVAVDLCRADEVERLRLALEPFGLKAAFDAELRLSGSFCTEVEPFFDSLELVA